MSRYITLTVKNGADIKIRISADADNTPVKIVSGSSDTTLTVGTSWKRHTITKAASTITIYGNIKELLCSNNGANLTGLDAGQNTDLTVLLCSNNQISNLDVSKNTELTTLTCSENQLGNLDVSQNTKLTMLNCAKNQLGSLDISQNTELLRFFCSNNQISNLDVSQNTKLTALSCYNNKISNLDVSKNTELRILFCENNQLGNLDVRQNTKLTNLRCYHNLFTTGIVDALFCSLPDRDIADNAKIYVLNNASDSNHADVLATNKQNATDKNWKVLYFNAGSDIPATTGSYVCGIGVANMSRYITLTVKDGADIKIRLSADADNTPVKIVSGSLDTTIAVSAAWQNETITAAASTITIYGNIQQFGCDRNEGNITGLDVSQNTELTVLFCYSNQISSLDVTQNTKLKGLTCYGNHLGNLDVSKNTELTWLFCYRNQLGNLDVSQNTKLNKLNCSENQLTTLDVSKNTKLTWLRCDNNQLSNLDISQNTELTWLFCYRNQLSNLDISQNTKLNELACFKNPFTTDAVDALFCSLPDRTGLSTAKIYILDNASDANYSDVLASNKQNATDKNWMVWYYDGWFGALHDKDIPGTMGIYDCSGTNMSRYITLTVKNGADIKLQLWADADNTPIKIVSGSLDTTLTVDDAWQKETITAAASTITIYGDIKQFNCDHNRTNLTGLDALQNTELTTLFCSDNQLGNLDLSQNTKLTTLFCFNNQLGNLDVSQNTELTTLFCYRNQLGNLDISQNTKLTNFDCSGNKISDLDVSQNTKLTRLRCDDNQLNSLDLSQNTELTTLFCNNNQLSNLDINANTKLKELYCFKNPFTTDAVDALFCSLPDRSGLSTAKIYILDNASDANYSDVLASNKQNATDKNWKVWYYDNYSGALHKPSKYVSLHHAYGREWCRH